jgi:hypothetical protein
MVTEARSQSAQERLPRLNLRRRSPGLSSRVCVVPVCGLPRHRFPLTRRRPVRWPIVSISASPADATGRTNAGLLSGSATNRCTKSLTARRRRAVIVAPRARRAFTSAVVSPLAPPCERKYRTCDCARFSAGDGLRPVELRNDRSSGSAISARPSTVILAACPPPRLTGTTRCSVRRHGPDPG